MLDIRAPNDRNFVHRSTSRSIEVDGNERVALVGGLVDMEVWATENKESAGPDVGWGIDKDLYGRRCQLGVERMRAGKTGPHVEVPLLRDIVRPRHHGYVRDELGRDNIGETERLDHRSEVEMLRLARKVDLFVQDSVQFALALVDGELLY